METNLLQSYFSATSDEESGSGYNEMMGEYNSRTVDNKEQLGLEHSTIIEDAENSVWTSKETSASLAEVLDLMDSTVEKNKDNTLEKEKKFGEVLENQELLLPKCCVNCNEYTDQFKHDNALKLFCDVCYVDLYNCKKDKLIDERISLCETCVVVLKNDEKTTQHECKRKDLFKCEHCDNVYKSEEKFISHTKIYKDGKFKCNICDEKFCKQGQFKSHCRKLHSEKCILNDSIRKNESNKSTKISRSNKLSIEKFSEECELHCQICKKECPTVPAMIEHIKNFHIKKKTFKCNYCDMFFAHKLHLQMHYKEHSNIKPYKCDQCRKSFARPGNLKRHIVVRHSNSGVIRNYLCDFCAVSFTTLDNLKLHLRIHSNERYFACDICEESFAREEYLKRHSRSHSGERAFKCVLCNKGFRLPGHLKRHLKVHTSEMKSQFLQVRNSFVCDICNKSFTRAESLNRHSKIIHLGEKLFECHICKKAFSLSNHLKNHIRIHTGERPFQCDICKKSFTQTWTLKRHKLIHISKSSTCNINDENALSSSVEVVNDIEEIVINDENVEVVTICDNSETKESETEIVDCDHVV